MAAVSLKTGGTVTLVGTWSVDAAGVGVTLFEFIAFVDI